MASMDVAFVKEQGVSFAVVSVKDHIVNCRSESSKVIAEYQHQFGVPTVLVGARSHKFMGRPDLAKFCANVGSSRLPWKRMTY